MDSSFRNTNPMVLVNYFDSYYCSLKPPDCSLYSEDGHEFPVHKELLCQTKFLCVIVNSGKMDCCYNRLEIMFPSLSRKDLEHIVKFLYSGRIVCKDQDDASNILSNLTKLLGFPESMDLSETVIEDMEVDSYDPLASLAMDNIEVGFDIRNVKTEIIEEQEYETQYDDEQYNSQSFIPSQVMIESDTKPDLSNGSKPNRGGDCPHCGKYYKSLKVHVDTMHSVTNPWKCELCPYSHGKKWGLRQHMKNKHEKKDGNCPYCGKYSKCLKNHIYRLHPEEVAMKKAEGEILDLSQLDSGQNEIGQDSEQKIYQKKEQIYIKKQLKNEPMDGICPHCGEYYKMLQKHILYQHETNKPWKCDECDYAHASKHGLNAHKKFSHATKDQMHVCEICGYKSASKSILKVHIQAVHDKKKEHICNTCERQFISKCKLEYHIRAIHLGEKNYKCPICSETFKCNDYMKLHIQKVHEGLKFECHQCKKDFRSPKELRRHNKNIHEASVKPKKTLQNPYNLQ